MSTEQEINENVKEMCFLFKNVSKTLRKSDGRLSHLTLVAVESTLVKTLNMDDL